MYFASDNAGPVIPEAFEAMARVNQGYAYAYGNDPYSESIRAQIRDLFEAPQAEVFFVPSGTAANALALASITRPFEAIFTHENAHIEMSEANAAEFFTGGAKLVTLAGTGGKIDPAALNLAVEARARGGVDTQRGPLSLTQVSDLGAVYDLDHIRALTGIADEFGLATHMDGARFANALVHLGCTPAEMTWKSGIDVLSFGGTKNGLMAAEAVVFFKPKLAAEFAIRRLRAGHMLSKQRFIAAQYEAYLEADRWLALARHANEMATVLERELRNVKGVEILQKREANLLFISLPADAHKRAQDADAMYYASPAKTGEINARLVCNWATSRADIDQIITLFKGPKTA